MKAVIGVDGSHGSLEAVRQAVQILNPETDSICLYYSPPAMKQTGVSTEVLESARAALTDAVLTKARSTAPLEWHDRIHTVVGRHDPRQGLLAVADEERADLLVVGARGMGRLRRLLVGSVSRTAVHNARIPVLVVRARLNADQGLRILWAHDDSENCEEVGAFIKQLHWPVKTRGRLLAVMPSEYPQYTPPWLEEGVLDPDWKAWADNWQREYIAEKDARQERLQKSCQRLLSVLPDSECAVAEGYPPDQILHEIEANHIDLVILGAHTMNGLSRLLLGSVSEAVLAHAPCSVLIAREHPQP